MVDTLYAAQAPATQDTDDGVSRQLGMRYEAQTAGQVTGGRYRVPSTGLPSTALWQLWQVTGPTSGTLLAEVDLSTLPSPTPSTWMAVPLGTPVAQAAGTEYVVCSYTDNGSFVFTFPSGVLPLTSTPDSRMVADAAVFRNGDASNVFPLAAGAPDHGAEDGLFFADVDFDVATASTAGPWRGPTPGLRGPTAQPTAWTGVPSGTAAITHDADVTVSATGSASATGARDAVAAATVAATGSSSATADRNITGTAGAAAIGGLSTTATQDLVAAGTVSAAGALTTAGMLELAGAGTVAGTGGLTVVGESGGDASTTVATTGSLTTAATVDRAGEATVAATTGLTAAGDRTAVATATAAALGGLLTAAEGAETIPPVTPVTTSQATAAPAFGASGTVAATATSISSVSEV